MPSGKVAGRCRRKVQIVDRGTGVAGFPLRHDLGCQLAGNGVGGEDAGVNVKQFHGLVLGCNRCGLQPWIKYVDEPIL